ncbi:phospholipase A2 inhibitor and Ly6/PLAUR domain-containing protein-like isoform X1 [Zootoca vivipara]|uniref:phospholipase A2 inhibitor and Ly6/PLAUR domain-containing protein-like isoform X1 n=1 Tax=Zootoca vivipara TaxID=8524 RepID=UPI00158FCAEB|nr:phospholipase A2 inhibitor and Ly6/PLAUR domain-containing protein-like isoform X1 [Zootoca vivipara]
MKLFLLHLSAALVATANSLNCVCTGSPECSTGTCSIPESEAICVTVAQQNNMEGILATGISRGCQQDSQLCNEAVSVTVSGGLFTRTISRCCTTENCNKTPLELPPRNLTKNGVNCPASFALGSNRLEETGTLSCTGDEKSCISAAGELTAGDAAPLPFIASGCASATACSLPVKTYLTTGAMDFLLKQIKCSPAPATNSG